jgi:hypothetical protein
MWMTILSFIGGPVIKGLIDAYQAKLKAGNVESKIAADLAAGEIAAQTSETNAITQLKIAEIGHFWEPEKLAFYIVLVHLAKCVIWDTVFGLGSTNALKGDIAGWEGLIMAYYFGKRTFENVARIIKR